MHLLVDENTAVQLLAPLRYVLPQHQVDHVTEVKWSGKKDVQLLVDAARKGYDALPTRDGRRLEDPDETDAIKKAGIHHIRYSQKEGGIGGLALAIGAIIAAMPFVVRELDAADCQRLVHIRGLSPVPGQRFESQDPRQKPPRYWR
ncbi:hypothetical protein [Streptomyces beigongshangae]|uniref:hypothetical protein n=1 Tax=Streptomyces beigongshangae TaxID=2841597 RepID=UPI001C85D4A9|nr:hypothetical protein [Streptomyces sp. REN17]